MYDPMSAPHDAEPPRPSITDRLAAQVLHKSPSGGSTGGEYDPLRNARYIAAGSDGDPGVAAMVSWHESFHAFLNASTTFGNTMMFLGAIGNAGYPGFDDAVFAMIGQSSATHEHYATIAGLCAVSRGPLKADLLDDFPDYQRYLESFITLFDPNRPKISVMILTSCARAAMQTPIYDSLRERPCGDWAGIECDPAEAPDQRFALLYRPELIAAARSAVDIAIAQDNETLAALLRDEPDPHREAEIVQMASFDEQELVNKTAFEVFAAALEAHGVVRPTYDAQKKGIGEIIATMRDYVGSSLDMEFHVPSSANEEQDALFKDFRRELLITGATPIPALFLDWREVADEVGDAFVLRSPRSSYLQLVAMPTAKAHHLYEPIERNSPLDRWRETSITGFRRYWMQPGETPRVDFLIVDRTDADRISERHPDSEIVVIVSLCTTRDDDWLAAWASDNGEATRLLVLIDDDPFDLLDRWTERGDNIAIARLSAAMSANPDAPRTELLCLSASREPDSLYIAPMTAPFRASIIEIAVRRYPTVRLDNAVLGSWTATLANAIPHLLREEAQFGMQFW